MEHDGLSKERRAHAEHETHDREVKIHGARQTHNREVKIHGARQTHNREVSTYAARDTRIRHNTITLVVGISHKREGVRSFRGKKGRKPTRIHSSTSSRGSNVYCF